ncbi:thioesterase family protein [Gordonia sp. ABSL1-1]|uniref:acyl-CoA thioesterase domain-containing protein n=1 Tax=Gordonia sp. ABSL1-1 TaxID=3053923 RepID=UPI0025744B2C|nr:acyl-CoA thioesterase domain-containing protein [Gordonia sp. ABSL1-1]MDL9935121.1 thioesterase family protein [Gordonia sp. ABSL1-1]
MSTIAFFTLGEDGHLHPTRFSHSLWAPNTLNGPAVCAIAARTAEREFSAPGFRPARFTIDLFKATHDVPTSLRSNIIRDGHRIRVGDVEIWQHHPDGREVMVARSTTVFLRESVNPPGERWSRAPESVTFHPPTVDYDDLRPRFSSDTTESAGAWDGEMARHQNGARKRLWARAAPPVAGEELTPFQHAVITAESTSMICNWGSTGIGFINCDLTVALTRLPVGQRVGVEADSHVEDSGISVSTSGLYDAYGAFGTGMVTAVNNAAAEIDFTTADTTGRYREA